ncbi:type II toxin-antitoxin system Phd/YefM family antitoxin [Brevundimonas aurifodinae]|uniref:Antitoxin n=2 Tax=Brevundimonas TaxID=41275 RepID=A0ABV1NRT0_9CAUL|nr:MAG: hypothetical protein B7Z42_12690 [Brevundimonas sp. 12-68-7]OYX33973.1 MAG: hypothetical protein B7Z01_07375 [Brevundimonas subvibrioides]
MAVTANIHEAKTTLSKLIQRALDGEEVIIAKAGKPLVTLKPLRQASSVQDRMAIFGKYEGQMILSDDWEESAFDAEMHRKWFGDEPAEAKVAEPPSRFDTE